MTGHELIAELKKLSHEELNMKVILTQWEWDQDYEITTLSIEHSYDYNGPVLKLDCGF